ncbi:MAG: amidohydrolase [Bacteroidetes bacterium]|nr:amidohydrolase [Bacteroidota bacterium]
MKTLLINAKVRCSRNNYSESVGFDSDTGNIIFTGSGSEAEKIKKDFDEVTDCGGKLVMPAFHDGHCHFIEGAYISSLLDLRDASYRNDFRDGIREYRAAADEGCIQGGFFAESNFKEEINLSREFLDSICDDIPVVISRFDTHAAFANSKALELSGILSRENDFTEEEIIRRNGIITGEIKERAREFILSTLPKPTVQSRLKAALNIMKRFNSYGITSISDITIVPDLEIYSLMLEKNSLLMNVDARLHFPEFYNIEKHKSKFEEYTELINFRSFKAFYDGTLSSGTAYMHSDYKDIPGRGIRTEYVNSGEFEKTAFEIDRAGYQISVHAIGDKAVTDLLDLNERLDSVNGKRDRRFRIEHAQHIREEDFDKFRDLNVIASVQPAHLFSDALTSSRMLQDPALEHNYDRLFKNGSRVCFGTDFPIVSENPFETIYFAVTRKADGFDNGFYPEKSILPDDCIDAYTINNAYASFSEDQKGTIQNGKRADLIILDQNIFEISADEIKDCSVNRTFFMGKEIYSA